MWLPVQAGELWARLAEAELGPVRRVLAPTQTKLDL